MPCIKLKDGFLCVSGSTYQYGGFTFEWHSYFGPIKLKKDGDPAERQGRKFFTAAERWRKLPKKEREKYRVER